MQAGVDEEGARLGFALADHVAGFVDDEEVAGPQLAPVGAVGVEQEPSWLARHGKAEVVVDALVEAVHHRRTEDHRKVGTRTVGVGHHVAAHDGTFVNRFRHSPMPSTATVTTSSRR